MVAVDFALGPSYEVVIAGHSTATDTREMIAALNKQFLPNKTIIFRASEETPPEIYQISPFVRHHRTRDGKATAYVCLNNTCQQPTTEITTMLSLISE